MYTLVIIGLALMNTSPGTNHASRMEIRNIATLEECQGAGASIANTLRENLGGNIRITAVECKPS